MALAVVKRVVQWQQSGSLDGSARFDWPLDGRVTGPLGVASLMRFSALAHYARHLAPHLPHAPGPLAAAPAPAPAAAAGGGEGAGAGAGGGDAAGDGPGAGAGAGCGHARTWNGGAAEAPGGDEGGGSAELR